VSKALRFHKKEFFDFLNGIGPGNIKDSKVVGAIYSGHGFLTSGISDEIPRKINLLVMTSTGKLYTQYDYKNPEKDIKKINSELDLMRDIATSDIPGYTIYDLKYGCLNQKGMDILADLVSISFEGKRYREYLDKRGSKKTPWYAMSYEKKRELNNNDSSVALEYNLKLYKSGEMYNEQNFIVNTLGYEDAKSGGTPGTDGANYIGIHFMLINDSGEKHYHFLPLKPLLAHKNGHTSLSRVDRFIRESPGNYLKYKLSDIFEYLSDAITEKSSEYEHLSFYFMHTGCREISGNALGNAWDASTGAPSPDSLTRQLSNSTDNTIRCFIQGFPEEYRPFLIKYFNDNSSKFLNMSIFYDHLRSIQLFDRWIKIMKVDENMYSSELYNIIMDLSNGIEPGEIRKRSIERMNDGEDGDFIDSGMSAGEHILENEIPDKPGLTMEPEEIQELNEHLKSVGDEIRRGSVTMEPEEIQGDEIRQRSVIIVPSVTSIIRDYEGNGYTSYQIMDGITSYYKRFNDFEELKTNLIAADNDLFKELNLDKLWPKKTWRRADEATERARMSSFSEIFGIIYDNYKSSNVSDFVDIIRNWLEGTGSRAVARLKSKKRIKYNKTRNLNIKKINKKRKKTKGKIKRKKTKKKQKRKTK
jgi:hypothetical protein